MQTCLRTMLLVLTLIFCIAYPIAVTGVAFDVQPPFSMIWAGSVLLLLEGALLIVAAMVLYGWWRGLFAGVLVIGCSYAIEALGVGTGWPFGVYRYTDLLVGKLPGGVPVPVLFAWVLVVFGGYSWSTSLSKGPAEQSGRVWLMVKVAWLAALLAMLLDLAIEPVAAYVVRYWIWSRTSALAYYGVPLANFVAWFVVAFLLIMFVANIFERGSSAKTQMYEKIVKRSGRKVTVERRLLWMPRLVFAGSLFMFGLVDLTHGYYWGTLLAIVAGTILAALHFGRRQRNAAILSR